jgi:hypothetical protein
LVGDESVGINIQVVIQIDIVEGKGVVTLNEKNSHKQIKLKVIKDGENIHLYKYRTQ